MSTFGRAHSDYLSPPEMDDVHPLSEEFNAYLEDIGIEESHKDHAVKMFDSILDNDRFKYLTYDDLFLMAANCTNFHENFAYFFHHGRGEWRAVRGTGFIDTLTKAINEYKDQEGVEGVQDILNYLFYNANINGDVYKKARDILTKFRYTYIFGTNTEE